MYRRRSINRALRRGAEAAEARAQSAPTPHERIAAAEDGETLRALIRTRPPKWAIRDAEALAYCHEDGCPYCEQGKDLGIDSCPSYDWELDRAVHAILAQHDPDA